MSEKHQFDRFAALCALRHSLQESGRCAVGNQVRSREGDALLGTYGGFQHVVLEYARNILGFENAAHAEYDPYASRMFVRRSLKRLV